MKLCKLWAGVLSVAVLAIPSGCAAGQEQGVGSLWYTADLKRWNNLRGQDIHVGQRLVVMR